MIDGVLKGDLESWDIFVQEGSRLSKSVSGKYDKKYFKDAFMGWMIALEHYVADSRQEKDYKFSTYATYFMKISVEKAQKGVY